MSERMRTRAGVRIVAIRGQEVILAKSADSQSVKFIGGATKRQQLLTIDNYREEGGREYLEETGEELDPARLIFLGIIPEIATGTSSDGGITDGTVMINAWFALLLNKEDLLIPHDDVEELIPTSLEQVATSLTYPNTRKVFTGQILPAVRRRFGLHPEH